VGFATVGTGAFPLSGPVTESNGLRDRIAAPVLWLLLGSFFDLSAEDARGGLGVAGRCSAIKLPMPLP